MHGPFSEVSSKIKCDLLQETEVGLFQEGNGPIARQEKNNILIKVLERLRWKIADLRPAWATMQVQGLQFIEILCLKGGKMGKQERKEEKEKTAELRQILSYIITVRKYFFKA